MIRSLAVIVGGAIALLASLGLGATSSLSFADYTTTQTQRTALPRWFLGLGSERKTPRVFLHGPKASADTTIALTVATDVRGARRFYLDVDLDHDGRFAGAGELAYADGPLDIGGTGVVRLHGLTPGEYRLRARAELADGSVVAGAVERLEVLPPPNSHLPIAFEVNRGQSDDAVLFQARAKHQAIFVTRDETVLVSGDHVSRFRLAGASSLAQPVGAQKLPGIVNYFIGNDPAKWRTNIETYQELRTEAVYPGIDLVYHSQRGRLQYDFHVAPGADPSVIGLEFADAAELTIDAEGVLTVRYMGGREERHSAPILYQMQNEQREAVKGSWILKGRNQVGYQIGDYDPRRELVIDPLVFSTFLGGSMAEAAADVAVDGAGNIYVAGQSMSLDFPTQAPIQTSKSVALDVVVSKINPAGNALLYSTYLGGQDNDVVTGIAVDAAGNAYVVASCDGAAPTFPTTPGSFQTAPTGTGTYHRGVVFKINAAGTALNYSGMLDNNFNWFGSFVFYTGRIAVDAAGNAYVTGWSTYRGGSLAPTPGTFTSPGVTAGANSAPHFFLKINPSGSTRLFLGYIGGSTNTSSGPGGVAVDSAGNVYLCGHTNCADFPVTPGVFQATPGGNDDAFVAKVNPGGTSLLYCTLLGGASEEFARGLAVDGAGNVYVAGGTKSATFPTTPGVVKPNRTNPQDGFVAKLNPTATALVYSTYLGGPDSVNGLAIDATNNAYVTGMITSGSAPPFPQVNMLQPSFGGGSQDAFVSVLNSSGAAFLMSSFLGGLGSIEEGGAIAVDSANNIYVVGRTDADTNGTVVHFVVAGCAP